MPSPSLGVGLSIKSNDPLMLDLPAGLDEMATLGVDFVELPLQDFDIVVGGRVLQDRLRSLKAMLADRPFRFTLHGHLGINLMEDAFRMPLHREILARNIEIAAELGCLHLVIHSGFVRSTQFPGIEDAYRRQRDELAETGDLARAHGVHVCVENIFSDDGRHTALPGRLAAEIAAVGHPHIWATFDFSHGYLHSTDLGADYLTEVKALTPYAKHLHLHDSFGRPDDFWTYTMTERLAFGIGDLHLPLGWGSIPWDTIANEARFPQDVVANIELNHRYWSEVRETIARARAFAERLVRA
jgi:sugar phosphate isomerase/epimerase